MLDRLTLDDLRYEDLVAEARALLPSLAPTWTDHNPSDPGIMLVELFAWLTEMVLYRLDQVPERSTWAFLQLLNGPQGQPSMPLEAALQATLLELRTPYRAVTCEDFEQLAWRWQEQKPREDFSLGRVRCVAERDLEAMTGSLDVDAPGHISVIVVPKAEEPTPEEKEFTLPGVPSVDVLQALRDYFAPRRLLTTRCHVVGPKYVTLTLRAALYLRPQTEAKKVRTAAAQAVRRYLHPLRGGSEGNGWPFGRNVHVSELLRVLSEVPGVDFVGVAGESLPQDSPVQGLTLSAFRTLQDGKTRQVVPTLPDGTVPLHLHELPKAPVPEDSFTLMRMVRGSWRAIP